MRAPLRLTLLILLLLLPLHTMADWQRIEALKNKVGTETPQTSGLQIGLPLVADDGASVPLKVTFNGTLAADEYISGLYVFASQNPRAEVIEFAFSDAIPRIEVSTRIRLSETQTVYVLAKSNQGNLWLANQDVRVTVSGCLMTDEDGTVTEAQMSQPRIALPRNPKAGEAAELRTMINHPMETGFREDSQGNLIPQQLIESLRVSRGDETLFSVTFNTGTSANPFVAFFLGQFDDLTFTWTDQQGQQLSETR